MNQRSRKSKGNRNRMIKLLAILALAFVLFLQFTPAEKSQGVVNYDKVIVCSGDTLWSIAEEYIDDSQDVRELIYDIKKLNGLSTAMISPGQELMIPCSPR